MPFQLCLIVIDEADIILIGQIREQDKLLAITVNCFIKYNFTPICLVIRLQLIPIKWPYLKQAILLTLLAVFVALGIFLLTQSKSQNGRCTLCVPKWQWHLSAGSQGQSSRRAGRGYRFPRFWIRFNSILSVLHYPPFFPIICSSSEELIM